jgi:hypothetical protein
MAFIEKSQSDFERGMAIPMLLNTLLSNTSGGTV